MRPRDGREYETHIDPIGAQMREAELRAVEDSYFFHKQAVAIGEPLLLVVTELAQWTRFRDGSSASNNVKVTPMRFERGALGDISIVVECENRPAHDNELTLPMVQKAIDVPRLGGRKWARGWPVKPFFHRTTASGQGQTLPVLVVHANNMTHYAVLYVGLTRGQVSASCWCCARLVRIGGRCWLGLRVCVCAADRNWTASSS